MRFTPPGFDFVAFALERAPTLSEAARAELERGPWAAIVERAPNLVEGWGLEVGALLAAGLAQSERDDDELAELERQLADPQRVNARATLLTAQAGLADMLARMASDARFETLPAELRLAARSFAALSLVRAAALEVEGVPDA
jgi:hypothetical protein